MSIFHAYDIRGILGKNLDPGIAYLIGCALAVFTQAKTIVVGRDMRQSSPTLRDALVKGIQDQGSNVVDIGLCSTPMFYWACQDAEAGIMVTASHNPPEYNGFKICHPGAIPIGGHNGLQEIERIVLDQALPAPAAKGKQTTKNILDEYVRFGLGFLKAERHWRIVVDAGNGMGGYTYGRLKELASDRLEIIPLFFDLDGTFPNRDPNPVRPEALKQLRQRVVAEKADLGIGLDGDADRIAFVDERGCSVNEDVMAALIARQILQEKPGSKILHDTRASWIVPEEITAAGGIPIETKVGHAFIKLHMREEHAAFAGEVTGHYYNAEQQNTENTMIILMRILNLLASSRKPLSSLAEPLSGRYAKSEERNFRVTDPAQETERIASAYENRSDVTKVSRIDGARIDFPDWWFSIRPSNTEPFLRLNIEARTEDILLKRTNELCGVIHPP